MPFEEEADGDGQRQPLDEDGVRGQLFCEWESGDESADNDSHKNEGRPEEPVQAQKSQSLRHAVQTEIEERQRDGRAQAESQQELRIRCIEALKLRNYPQQKKGRDQEQTGDEEGEHRVTGGIHTAGGRYVGGMSGFLEVSRKKPER